MSDEELQVVIDPEEVIPPEGTVTADAKAEKIQKSTEPAVDDLKAQVAELTEAKEADRKAREEAQRRARELQAEVERAHQRASDSDLSTITQAIETAQSEIEQAKKDIRSAKDAGDLDAEVDAMDRMTTAKATYLRLDESKADAEARKKAPPRDDSGRFAPNDPVEHYVRGRTEPTATWLRAHPEFITNQKKNNKLTAAHYDAESEGYAPDTPEYFDHVETFLGLKGKAAPIEAPQTKPAKRQSEAAPVAPTAATANGGTAPSDKVVRLTTGEARAATDGTHVWERDDPKGHYKKGDPIGTAEMGRRKYIMTKQGRYDRSFTES